MQILLCSVCRPAGELTLAANCRCQTDVKKFKLQMSKGADFSALSVLTVITDLHVTALFEVCNSVVALTVFGITCILFFLNMLAVTKS